MGVEDDVMRIQKKLNKMTSGDGTVGSIIIEQPMIRFFASQIQHISSLSVETFIYFNRY